MWVFRRILSLVLLALIAGCASTPQATPQRDVEAKEFRSHPATAAIYVYRTDPYRRSGDSVLYLDDRLIGATLPGTFFRVDTRPGRHVLRGLAYDNGHLEIEVRPGDVYFVALQVLGGISHFALRDPQVGRNELASCCALLENWAPGQRPLLR